MERPYEKFFTGQATFYHEGQPACKCFVCGSPLILNSTAWYDPYRGKTRESGKRGKYVCRIHLSARRKAEIPQKF